MTTAVTKYLDSKKIDYQLDGLNAIACCPICKEGNKWGIHIESGLWSCFRGKCGAKGNLKTLRRHFGDPVEAEVISNLEDDEVKPTKARSPEAIPDWEAHHKKLLENDEVMNYLNDDRGFSIETIKEAKLGLSARNFGNGAARALTFPYFEKGKCLGIKYKSLAPDPKDFRFTAGRDVGLYMADRVVKGMESLIICEGETDALMLLQQGYTNVVGVSGANSKKADWADLLDLPKKLYLVMDNDEVGVEGAKTFATRFGIDRFHIVNIPALPLDIPIEDKHGTRTTISDVNEFFFCGHTKEEFDLLLEQAQPFALEGVTSMDAAFENLISDFEQRGSTELKYKFLWPSVNLKAKGIDEGDLIAVLASRKVGKTTWVLNQLEFMLSEYKMNVHFECLEMRPEQLTKKWAAMYLGVDEDLLTIPQLRQAQAADRARDNHFYFSQSSPKNEDDMINIMRKTARRYAVGVSAFDNLQLLVDTTITKVDRNARPAFISSITKKFKRLAGELKIPIFMISQPKNVQDGEMVSASDSEGSGALANDCDLFFTLNRAREAKMKMDAMASLGNFETNQSHSDDMYVETALSRRSPGGFVTLKIDGAKSTIREFNAEETPSGQRKAMIGNIVIIDDNETVAI